MRSIRPCLLAISVAVLAADAGALEAVVRKPSANVRAAPKVDAAVIATLKQNAAVTIAAQTGLWYQLSLSGDKKGFIRVNDLRVNYAGTEGGEANVRALTRGKAGQGRVTETAGVRGLEKSELAAATRNDAQLAALIAYRIEAPVAAQFAQSQSWQATAVPFDAEPERPRPAAAEKTDSKGGARGGALAAAEGITGLAGGLGRNLGAFLGTARKAAPKAEAELSAEELALGPEIVGRVLGARPLWNDPNAQKRVNLIGRWVASQTSRPELPWTFGIIDTPEVNAFAAPGGFVLLTRGIYELLGSDAELAAVLGHEIGHCVQRDHYTVIRKQQLASLGKEELSNRVQTGSSTAEVAARRYVEENGAAIILTSLDRDAEFRADHSAEIYLARSGLNPVALYSVLQKMVALGEKSASLAQLYQTHPPLDARLDRIDSRAYSGLEPYTTRE